LSAFVRLVLSGSYVFLFRSFGSVRPLRCIRSARSLSSRDAGRSNLDPAARRPRRARGQEKASPPSVGSFRRTSPPTQVLSKTFAPACSSRPSPVPLPSPPLLPFTSLPFPRPRPSPPRGERSSPCSLREIRPLFRDQGVAASRGKGPTRASRPSVRCRTDQG